jgi:hypothetical protein
MRELNTVDIPLHTIIDDTDPLYLYVSSNLDPKAVSTDATWYVWRITLATGTLKFANSDNKPKFQASEAQNYTYS